MHVIDLNGPTAPVETVGDVCIVGAGAAGLFLAQRLGGAGVRVVVVEAGGARATDTASAGMSPIFSEAVYSGAVDGRSFGLGGSTTRWGGVLVPHCAQDIRRGDRDADVWRRIVDVAAMYGPAVAGQLGLAEFLDAPSASRKFSHERPAGHLAKFGLCPRYSAYLGFRARNFAQCLQRPLHASAQLTIVLNCVITDWKSHAGSGGAEFETARGRSRSGNDISVKARWFILAAGAIETTRILLEIGRRILPTLQQTDLGLGLSDHLSVPIASIQAGRDRRIFAPRFHRGIMYAIRFVGDDRFASTPRFFLHHVFDFRGTGVEVVKNVLSSVQAGRRPKVKLRELLTGAVDLGQLAARRFLQKTLHLPDASRVHLQLDIEQQRHPENRIMLDDTLDEYGRPKAIVQWDIRDTDRRNIRNVTEQILGGWPQHPGALPALERLPQAAYNAKPYDAYHPVGTCRMGTDHTSVVGLDLRVKGAANLSVVSTAIFPTAGTANPTFSMLCFSEELACRLLAGGL